VRPAVQTASGGKRGGGASLTAAGMKLVRSYRALERQTALAVGKKLKPLLRTMPRGDRAAA